MKKSILIHILFWAGYIAIWSVHDLTYYPHYIKNIETNCFKILPYVPIVYLNLLYLIPTFLLKRRIKLYTGLISIAILFTTILSSKCLAYFYYDIREYAPKGEFYESVVGQLSMLTDVLLTVFFSTMLFLLNEWYIKDEYAKEIEKKQLEAELGLLKTQLNPHFLFNALNSIYIMVGKNLSVGKEMLIQFSDLLSHQLYDSQQEMVSLQKEFDNLERYINLERMRHDDLVTVKIDFPKTTSNLKIAPMLLLPIVENAFKHGQSNTGYWINIEAKIDTNNMLNFTAKNSNNNEGSVSSKSGIGLSNLRKRLGLIYNQKHTLSIQNSPKTFNLDLQLQLYDPSMLNVLSSK